MCRSILLVTQSGYFCSRISCVSRIFSLKSQCMLDSNGRTNCGKYHYTFSRTDSRYLLPFKCSSIMKLGKSPNPLMTLVFMIRVVYLQFYETSSVCLDIAEENLKRSCKLLTYINNFCFAAQWQYDKSAPLFYDQKFF